MPDGGSWTIAGQTLYIDGNSEAVFALLRETAIEQLHHSLQFVETECGYVVRLLKICEDRRPIDDNGVCFLRVFHDGVSVIKISIDKELAEDSHYELVLPAARRLYAVLKRQYGAKSLPELLRLYLCEHPLNALVSLLHCEKIPFR